ncbi:hypothetical protein [Staphylococcus aureus]|uniref:hypothetical protein n=1 Tax=Staphylococcus aureus TaxID=1280 RepID=UPI000DE3D471|nr:hypothetical protein [Staphylococcus aureus]
MQNVFRTIAKAYMISGDVNGYSGIRRNEIRIGNMNKRNDEHQLAEDWKKVRLDIKKALNN